MPLSTDLTDGEIREAVTLISHERLSTFLRITGTERDALDLHFQAMAVASALMRVTGTIEIALRNAICERLRVMFAVQNWLATPPLPFEWKDEEKAKIGHGTSQAQRAAYATLSNAQKKALDATAFPTGVPPNIKHATRAKARQKQIIIPQGQLIAQLTLFFWKRLFSPDYEPTLWKRALKRLFPNKALTRADVAANLEVIYQTRNRIAHHEPVLSARLADALAAIDFVVTNFGMSQPGTVTVLAKMLAPLRETLRIEAELLNEMVNRFSVPLPPANAGNGP